MTLRKAGKTKPSPMNHGKGKVVGQLVPVEYNRLIVSDFVSIDEPSNGYMEMLEYRNSARGHLMALEDQSAMEGYLDTMMQGTTLKQKAYGTLLSSEMHKETIEQLVSLPWRAVVLRFFEEELYNCLEVYRSRGTALEQYHGSSECKTVTRRETES